MNPVQNMFYNMVISFFATTNGVLEESAINSAIDQVKCMPLFASLTDDEVEEVRNEVKTNFSFSLNVGSVLEEKGHEKWFLAKKGSLDMRYWERYKKYLLNDCGYALPVVNKMDDILDTITDLLGDPSRDVTYSRKGLVIGDVQSGKTSNYLGLITKAVDSGYKVIVLLTGTIEKLRKQTQERVDLGFVGVDSDAMLKNNGKPIGAGVYDPAIRPVVLTSKMDDFKSDTAKNLGFDLKHINGPVIFVIKKNSSILKRLNKWLETFNQGGIKKQIDEPILVIDDEADNASVNTNKEEDKPTAINAQIRDLINRFSKSSYVGFTATPYANIFIDPETTEDMKNEDLFPKNYIYSLDAPSNYTGARDVYSESGKAAFMLRTINENTDDPGSIANVLPLKHKSGYYVPCLPEDLKEAIRTYMLANVLEDIAGLKNNHRSMLINVSRFTAVQEDVAVHVRDYVKDLQNACKNYCNLEPSTALKNEFIRELKDTFDLQYEEIDCSWEQVFPELSRSNAGVVVHTFNSNSGHDIDYSDYPYGLRIIAVGGMALSRGLTLEGLVVSYFYRNSKMYDTLMQMGRWFGFRGKYEKFCRIWMAEESIEYYKNISEATDELRKEVKRYENSSLTPLDFGLRVRCDINSLLVTARNKMRTADKVTCTISFSGVTVETPFLYTDDERNATCFNQIKVLLNEAFESGCEMAGDERNRVLKNVDSSHIIDFLETYDISPLNSRFDCKTISDFIKSYKGDELRKWDIAFASGQSDRYVDFGLGISQRCVKRTFSFENNGKIMTASGKKHRLGSISDGRFGLTQNQIDELSGHVTKQSDYFIDVARNPLLVIYSVEPGECTDGLDEDMKSKAEKLKNQTVFGLGIGIPTLKDHKTQYATYVLTKIAMQQMLGADDDEMEADD